MPGEAIAAKSCAHPSCSCRAEAGKEFCSDACRNAKAPTGHCVCGHPGCTKKKSH